MRRLAPMLVGVAALAGAGLVYAQVAPQEPPPTSLPDPFPDPPPPESLPDPLGAPPAETVIVPPPADPALTAQENTATALAEAEVAEAIDPEDLEPPPPPPPPMKRPRYQAAVIQAVDKISAETMRFEAKVGQPVRYKSLVFTVRACEGTAPDEDVVDQIAHLEVISAPKPVEGREPAPPRQVFRGWTFASAPALHPFEHSVYDAWLISCRTSAPVAAAGRR